MSLSESRRTEIAGPCLASAARASLGAVMRAGSVAYSRERMLPGLIGALPWDVPEPGPEASPAILARLARALRAERNRGRAGHWTYDLNRHIALRQAYDAERNLLRASTGKRQARSTS